MQQIPAAPTETNHSIYVCQFDLKYLTINFTLKLLAHKFTYLFNYLQVYFTYLFS